MSKGYDLMVQNPRGLSVEDIRWHVPSIFADAPAEDRSDRYLFIPTDKFIYALAEIGFVPILAMQARSRRETGREHAKHLLRFAFRNDLGKNLSDFFNLVFRNSSDGSSAYDCDYGYFSMVCRNGMLAGDFEEIHVQHRGNILEQVVKASLQAASNAPQVMAHVEEYKQVVLEPKERLLLAEHVHTLRFGEKADEVPIRPSDLLIPAFRAHADQPNTLYNTVETVQYHAINGGQVRRDHRTGKRTRTRTINGIAQNTILNKAIGAFADELRKLHS